ncbi:Catabolic 3-dehydroquinase 2 [Thelotrema lepadinum]|nr:Catabolic 3-dehydroquinase 2 [Thelotrema lepadinum]
MSQPRGPRTRTILLLNGPNLNLLGTREPNIYGRTTLADVEAQAAEQAQRHGVRLEAFQSNHEGVLIDRIHAGREGQGRVDAIVVNAGALTHTSVGLRDALAGVAIPFVEVHVSNVYRREPFRHHSYLSDKAEAVVVGLGVHGYAVAIDHLVRAEDNSIGRRVAKGSRL